MKRLNLNLATPKIRHTIKLQPARSPSDILWLNRGVNKLSQWKRGGVVSLIIFLSSVLVFILFTINLQMQFYVSLKAQPPNVNCLL